MLKFAVATLASACLVGAQATNDDSYHPHAAVAFVRTGERTPTFRKGPSSVLTALGAQQMFKLGQNLRTRYITGNTPAGLGVQHIAGMSPNALNNDQISVQTSDEQYVVSSAQAFMQGLYPPRNIANSNGTGFTGSLLSNGSAIDYPLGGYQYANIQSSGQLDPESIYVAGSQHCPTAERDAMMYYTTDKFSEIKAANNDFYNGLNLDWFEGNLNRNDLSYTNAVGINDYLQYQYAHNSTTYRTLANDSSFAGVYDKVRTLADEQAWYLYGNTSAASNDPDNQAMGGKTLAAKVLGSFQLVVADKMSAGDQTDLSYPLNFMFGEIEPFMSLISLMSVDYHDAYFRSIPAFGSAMIFELFSTGANTTFPASQEDLRVRFYFHNGTDADFDDGQLTAFPFFGNGPSRTDMPYLEFEDLFSRIMVSDVNEWCEQCTSSSLFCWGVDDANVSPSLPYNQKKTSKLSPAVAGVIGAIVTLFVASLLFGAVMLLGGLRFHRRPPSKKSELGGFKGSAKLASDPDVSLVGNGAPPAGISFGNEAKRGHERVGSWELRQKELGERERREEFEEACGRVVTVEERV